MERPSLLALSVVSLLLTAACADPPGGATSGARPGDPLPGLTAAEAVRFAQGRSYFTRGWSEEDGVGPLYLQDRCASCHDLPAPGGTGVESLPRTNRWTAEGCDALGASGGDIVQSRVSSTARAAGVTGEERPPDATAAADLLPPLLYGVGLVEAIPDRVILAREDPVDADGDGISGRAGRTADGRVGRFGRKADVATLAEGVAGAFVTELGLTSRLHPHEVLRNGAPTPPAADPVPDPELAPEVLDRVEDFLRFLALPPRAPAEDRATRTSVALGETVFREIGCASCHVPTLRTGPSEHAALDRREVRLYSDLLLHDMGEGLSDLCGAGAAPAELRTERLTGLRYRRALGVLLHDGRVETVHASILAHGGEGARSRSAYLRLRPATRDALLRFLETL